MTSHPDTTLSKRTLLDAYLDRRRRRQHRSAERQRTTPRRSSSSLTPGGASGVVCPYVDYLKIARRVFTLQLVLHTNVSMLSVFDDVIVTRPRH